MNGCVECFDVYLKLLSQYSPVSKHSTQPFITGLYWVSSFI
jgi:hypothetical protein